MLSIHKEAEYHGAPDLIQRVCQVFIVVGALVATYIAWNKVTVEHAEYGSVALAVVFWLLAIRVMLGWFGVMRNLEFDLGTNRDENGNR